MAPILGIYASQISGHLFQPSGAWDSIATTTLGSTQTTVTFSSIPSTYTHLQIRGIVVASGGTWLGMQYNSDSTFTNYRSHQLEGDGGTAYATSFQSSGQTGVLGFCASGQIMPLTIDVLDYTNSSKNTTARSLQGYDANGSGLIRLASSVWLNTAAVSSISLVANFGGFAQYSQFALYGIKGN
jgi:hypothetical protein